MSPHVNGVTVIAVIEKKQTEDGGMSTRSKALVSASQIEQSILLLRGQKVLLDSALAGLYGGTDQSVGAGGPTEPHAVPRRLHVPAYES